MQNENYTPYGKEWEKEMMKLPKKAIIQMLRETCTNTNSLAENL